MESMTGNSRLSRRKLLLGATSAIFLHQGASEANSEITLVKARIRHIRYSRSNKRYAYRKIADPTGTAPSNMVERFEVRGGDCPVLGDCKPRPLNGRMVQRTRSERVLLTDLSEGQEGLFTYHFMFPRSEFNIVDSIGTTFGQVMANYSRDNMSDGGPIFTFDTNWGHKGSPIYVELNEAIKQTGGQRHHTHIPVGNLGRDPSLFDRWHKVDVFFRLSTREDGFMSFAFNGKEMGQFRGRTMLPGGATEVRYGVYQSGTNQYPGGRMAVPTQVVYYAAVGIFRVERS